MVTAVEAARLEGYDVKVMLVNMCIFEVISNHDDGSSRSGALA